MSGTRAGKAATPAEAEILDRFAAGEITAEQMVEELGALRPRPAPAAPVDPIPESLKRAQAAVRRINRMLGGRG